MPYEYDVFVSYRRQGEFGKWVEKVFFPEFRQLLPEMLNEPNTRIFFDEKEVRTGDDFRHRIRTALACSRCLVPIWIPSYFWKDPGWCLLELDAFRRREVSYK